MVNASTATRTTVMERPLDVMALTRVEPSKPFFAFACKAGPGLTEKAKNRKAVVVARAYGATSEEALQALQASLKDA